MSSTVNMKPALRVDPTNPNHHIYRNNGTWWIHYTLHLQNYTVQRVRKSLKTADETCARKRRDLWLAGLLGEGGAV